MKVYRPSMQFHAVHLQPDGERRTRGNRDKPRHIIDGFVCRKARDFVWSQGEAIKKTENYKDAFYCARFDERTGPGGRQATRSSSLCQKGIQPKCSYT